MILFVMARHFLIIVSRKVYEFRETRCWSLQNCATTVFFLNVWDVWRSESVYTMSDGISEEKKMVPFRNIDHVVIKGY